jgi:hypothetical protein
MPKFILETRKITHYSVTIEADSEEAAQAQIDEWVSDDFEEFTSHVEWLDGEIMEEEVGA